MIEAIQTSKVGIQPKDSLPTLADLRALVAEADMYGLPDDAVIHSLDMCPRPNVTVVTRTMIVKVAVGMVPVARSAVQ